MGLRSEILFLLPGFMQNTARIVYKFWQAARTVNNSDPLRAVVSIPKYRVFGQVRVPAQQNGALE